MGDGDSSIGRSGTPSLGHLGERGAESGGRPEVRRDDSSRPLAVEAPADTADTALPRRAVITSGETDELATRFDPTIRADLGLPLPPPGRPVATVPPEVAPDAPLASDESIADSLSRLSAQTLPPADSQALALLAGFPRRPTRAECDELFATLASLAPDELGALILDYETRTSSSLVDVLNRIHPARTREALVATYNTTSQALLGPIPEDDAVAMSDEVRLDDAQIVVALRESLPEELRTTFDTAIELLPGFAIRRPPLVVTAAEVARFCCDGVLSEERAPMLHALQQRLLSTGDARAARLFASLYRISASLHHARANDIGALIADATAALTHSTPEGRVSAQRRLFGLLRARHRHETLAAVHARAAHTTFSDARQARLARTERSIARLSSRLASAATEAERSRLATQLANARATLHREVEALRSSAERTAERRGIAVSDLPASLREDVADALDGETRCSAMAISAHASALLERATAAGERAPLPRAEDGSLDTAREAERFDPLLSASADLTLLTTAGARHARERREAHLGSVTSFHHARRSEATARLQASGLYTSEASRRADPTLPIVRDGVEPTEEERALVRDSRDSADATLTLLDVRLGDRTANAPTPHDAATMRALEALRQLRTDVLVSLHESEAEDVSTLRELADVDGELAYLNALAEVGSTAGVGILDANGRPFSGRMGDLCRAALPRLRELQAQLEDVRSRDSGERYLEREPYARALQAFIAAGEASEELASSTEELSRADGRWSELARLERTHDVRTDLARREELVGETLSGLTSLLDDPRRSEALRSRRAVLQSRIANDPDHPRDEDRDLSSETAALRRTVDDLDATLSARASEATGPLPDRTRERAAVLALRSEILNDVAVGEAAGASRRAFVQREELRASAAAARIEAANRYRIGDGYYLRTDVERAEDEANVARESRVGTGIDRDTRARALAEHDAAQLGRIDEALSHTRRERAAHVNDLLLAAASARHELEALSLDATMDRSRSERAALQLLVGDLTARRATALAFAGDSPELVDDWLLDLRRDVRTLSTRDDTVATIRQRLDAGISETAALSLDRARRSYRARGEDDIPADPYAVTRIRELALGGAGDGFPVGSRSRLADPQAEASAARAEAVVARLDESMRAIPDAIRAHTDRLTEERDRTLAALRLVRDQGEDTRISFWPFGEANPLIESYVRDHPDMTVAQVMSEVEADYQRRIEGARSIEALFPRHVEGLALLDEDVADAYRTCALLQLALDPNAEAAELRSFAEPLHGERGIPSFLINNPRGEGGVADSIDDSLSEWLAHGGPPNPDLLAAGEDRVGLATLDESRVHLVAEADSGLAAARARVAQIADWRPISDTGIDWASRATGAPRSVLAARREAWLNDLPGPLGSMLRVVDSPAFVRAVSEAVLMDLATIGLGSVLSAAGESAAWLARGTRASEYFASTTSLGRTVRAAWQPFTEVSGLVRSGFAEVAYTERALGMVSAASRTLRLGEAASGLTHMALSITLQQVITHVASGAFGEHSRWTRVIESLSQGLFANAADRVAGLTHTGARLALNGSIAALQQAAIAPTIEWSGTVLANSDGVVDEDERAVIDGFNFVVQQAIGALVPVLVGQLHGERPRLGTDPDSIILERALSNQPPLRLDDNLHDRVESLSEALEQAGLTPDEAYVAALGGVHSVYAAMLTTVSESTRTSAIVAERLSWLTDQALTAAGRAREATSTSATPTFGTASQRALIASEDYDVLCAALQRTRERNPERMSDEIVDIALAGVSQPTETSANRAPLVASETMAHALEVLAELPAPAHDAFLRLLRSAHSREEQAGLLAMLVVNEALANPPETQAQPLGAPHGLRMPDGSIQPVFLMDGDSLLDSHLHLRPDAMVEIAWNTADGSEHRQLIRLGELCDLQWHRSDRAVSRSETGTERGEVVGAVRLPGATDAHALILNSDTGRFAADTSRRFALELGGLSALSADGAITAFDQAVATLPEPRQAELRRALEEASPEVQMLLLREVAASGNAENAFSLLRYIDVAFLGRTPTPEEILSLGTLQGLRQYLGHSCVPTAGLMALALESPLAAFRMAARGADSLQREQAAILREHAGRVVSFPAASGERVVGVRGRRRADVAVAAETPGSDGLFVEGVESALNRIMFHVLAPRGLAISTFALQSDATEYRRTRLEGMLFRALAESRPPQPVPIGVEWLSGGAHEMLVVGVHVVDESGHTIEPGSSPHDPARTTYMIFDPGSGAVVERSAVDLIAGTVGSGSSASRCPPARLSQISLRMASVDRGVAGSTLHELLRSEWVPAGVDLSRVAISEHRLTGVVAARGGWRFNFLRPGSDFMSLTREEILSLPDIDHNSDLYRYAQAFDPIFTEGTAARVTDEHGVERSVIVRELAITDSGLVYRLFDPLTGSDFELSESELSASDSPLVGVAADRAPFSPTVEATDSTPMTDAPSLAEGVAPHTTSDSLTMSQRDTEPALSAGTRYRHSASGNEYRIAGSGTDAVLIPMVGGPSLPIDADTLSELGMVRVPDHLQSPREFRRAYVSDTLQSYRVSEAEGEALIDRLATDEVDPITGFNAPADYPMTVRRATAMANHGEATVTHVRYTVENLAGMNGVFSEADVDYLVIAPLASRIRALLQHTGLQIECFRRGGSFDVLIIDEASSPHAERIAQARAEVTAMISDFLSRTSLPLTDGSGRLALTGVRHPRDGSMGVRLSERSTLYSTGSNPAGVEAALREPRPTVALPRPSSPAVFYERARLETPLPARSPRELPHRLTGDGEPILSDTFSRLTEWRSTLARRVPAELVDLLFVRAGGSALDLSTGAERATARRPTIERALERVRRGEHGVYAAIDLRNLRGLSEVLGTDVADGIYAHIVELVVQHLGALNVDGSVVRYGGDELCVVMAGDRLSAESVNAALSAAAADIEAFTRGTAIIGESGRRATLADIGHSKHLDSERYNGVGIVSASVAITPLDTIDSVIEHGSEELSQAKADLMRRVASEPQP